MKRMWRVIGVLLVGVAGWAGMSACRTQGTMAEDAGGTSALTLLSETAQTDAGAGAWIDCVGVLHVIALRGARVANAVRVGDGGSANARLADLSPSDLRAFCDWEACIRANGYGHACGTDAGWEACRVCRGSDDCGGTPMNQDECVAHATDPGRAECHVGLLEECLLQRAVRGPSYPCVTTTCAESAQACAGGLPGDLSARALAARHETDQITIEEFRDELASQNQGHPDAASSAYWADQLALWDGGASSCGNGPPDGGAPDAPGD